LQLSLAPLSNRPGPLDLQELEPASPLRDVAKASLCGLYKYSGAMAVQERIAYWAGRRAAAVLLFHRVCDDIPSDGVTVGMRWFRRLCELMRDRFHVVPLDEALRLVGTGTSLPRRTVAITFDDCYRDNLHAAQVLAEFGLPACFFVPTQYVGTDHVFAWDRGLKTMPNLGWDDLHEMVRLGHEIGSHTVSHADLGLVGVEEARRELHDSKKTLENRLGRPARWLAYPYGGIGNFRPEYLPLVREAGYEACFSGYGGVVRPGMLGQVLPREPMPYFRSMLNLELHLAGCLDWFYGLKRRAGLIPGQLR
jgi:peptidoglycan/xylan/chitin deacetylase (PgdA/CDA1 family)